MTNPDEFDDDVPQEVRRAIENEHATEVTETEAAGWFDGQTVHEVWCHDGDEYQLFMVLAAETNPIVLEAGSAFVAFCNKALLRYKAQAIPPASGSSQNGRP